MYVRTRVLQLFLHTTRSEMGQVQTVAGLFSCLLYDPQKIVSTSTLAVRSDLSGVKRPVQREGAAEPHEIAG